jgi:hypothetical protein
VGSRPSATADPSALAWKLPYVRATGFGAAVVPDVCITATVTSAPPAAIGHAGADPCSGSAITTSAPARRCARSDSLRRRSTGTAAADASRQPWSATTNSSPGASASATRAPLFTPSRCSAPAAAIASA